MKLKSCYVAALLVHQATAKCSTTGTTILSKASDVSSLNTCKTFTGDITIATDTPETKIELELEYHSGNLTIEDVPTLAAFHAPKLLGARNLVLRRLEQLKSLDLSALEKVILNFHLEDLPALVALPLPDFQAVYSSLSVHHTSLTTFAILTYRPKSNGELSRLTISDNPQLVSIEAPQLYSIWESLSITGNGKIKSIDGFPNLETVGEAIELNGTFFQVSFPSLTSASKIILDSTQDISNACNHFLRLNSTVPCQTVQSAPEPSQSTSADPSSSSDGNSNQGSTQGKGVPLATSIGVGVGVGVGALLLFALCLYLVRRRRRSAAASASAHGKRELKDDDRGRECLDEADESGAELGSESERHELEQPASPSELPVRTRPMEMGRSTSSKLVSIESRHEI